MFVEDGVKIVVIWPWISLTNKVYDQFIICKSFYELKSQGHVSRKSRKLFGAEKPFVKLRLAYSVKLVFSYFVQRIKIEITSKFRASRGLCFQDTKRKFRDFWETSSRTGFYLDTKRVSPTGISTKRQAKVLFLKAKFFEGHLPYLDFYLVEMKGEYWNDPPGLCWKDNECWKWQQSSSQTTTNPSRPVSPLLRAQQLRVMESNLELRYSKTIVTWT